MKITTALLLFVFFASGLYADNQVVERKYHNKSFKNVYLSIVSFSLNAELRVKFLASQDMDERQTMVYTRLRQGLPRAFEEASSCSRTEMCTTAVLDSVSPRLLELDHGQTIYLNLPSRMHFPGKKNTWPRHCLVIEISEVYDDSSTKYVDVAAGGAFMAGGGVGLFVPVPVITFKDKETAEECLHYSCKYAFIDCSNGALVCYGRVKAEGCGRPTDRYGPAGVWAVSLRDLVKQIVEDSPFEMKMLNARDFH
jgi:hypothetical protein